MLTLTSTQVNQINSLLRTLKVGTVASSHPDWPIWVVATKLYEQTQKQQKQLQQQDAKITNLENQIATLNQQITNVARNAAVVKSRLV